MNNFIKHILRLSVVFLVLGQSGFAAEPSAQKSNAVEKGVLSDENRASMAEYEQRMEEARQQLDEAAEKFAELTSQRFAGLERLAELERYEIEFDGRKASLGIMLNPMAGGEGLPLLGITPGSGAEAAGLQAGDVILDINGVSLKGLSGHSAVARLTEALQGLEPGTAVPVGYEREGTYDSVEVIASDTDAAMVKVIQGIDPKGLHEGLSQLGFSGPGASSKHGLHLYDADAELGRYFGIEAGVLVLKAPPESGLQAGDVIQQVAGQEVTTANDTVHKMMQTGEQAELSVLRHGSTESVLFPTALVKLAPVPPVKAGLHVIRINAEDSPRKEIEIFVDDS